MIDRIPEIDNMSETGLRPNQVSGHIVFSNVHFAYPKRSEVRVLNGFSLSIAVGEKVALVGASGCGKSTIVSLIQRLYDPLEGSVSMDGNDLRDLNTQWLREMIGTVTQEPVLFNTTVEQNIRMGR